MLPETADRLLELNRRFYQSFAEPFAATRRRPQAGVLAVAARIDPAAAVLDLGCGSGSLAGALAGRSHRGAYLGVDAEPELLAIARAGDVPEQSDWLELDLAQPGWSASIAGPFDVACAFAVLHHLPAGARRLAWANEVRQLVGPHGWMALSVWDFLALPEIEARIVPWSTLKLDPDQLEPGDYLVDWRQGGRGVRYVHHFTQDELTSLAEEAGWVVTDSFRSDGRGGKLGLYQLWVPRASKGAIL